MHTQQITAAGQYYLLIPTHCTSALVHYDKSIYTLHNTVYMLDTFHLLQDTGLQASDKTRSQQGT